MIPNTPAWKIIFEALKPAQDLARLESLSAEHPDENELLTICRDHGILLIVNQALKGVRHKLFSVGGQEQWYTEAATYTLLGLTMHRELQHLLARFAFADIPVAPFKGPTLSEQIYGDPALRMFADLDLLVLPDHVCATVALLIEDGYQPTFKREELQPWLRPGSQVNHCILRHSSGRWMVEVHWELFAEWRKSYSPDKVENEWHCIDVDDVIDTLIYLCLHGTHHWWILLKWVVDVDRYVRFAQGLDWDDLFARARERGSMRAVCLALFLARQSCGLELPERVSAGIEGDRKVAVLARRVARYWPQPTTLQPSLPWKIRYLLACRERFSDKIGMLLDYPVARSFPCFKHSGRVINQ
jgi:hypothetical protein